MFNLLKYLILSFTLLVFFDNIYASHIVGGDMRVSMTSQIANGAYYNIQVRLFRDDFNGNISMPTFVKVGVYEIGTNNQVGSDITINRNSLGMVSLGDPCYTPPSNIQIQEGIYETTTPVLLPNYSNGYYLQYQTYSRNAIITNLDDPDSQGISLYAEIPDPSLGQNSSPDFGIYPADAYLCINNIKVFNFQVTDVDGDSLVYSLVDPLDSDGTATGTNSGSGLYPYYPSCVWNTPYSLSNICGGSPPMSINSSTGDITASPSSSGYFVFAVRVEEYRNGVKLGESRRELQYASLPCQVANPPQISVNDDPGSSNLIEIDAYVDNQICFDIEVDNLDPDDSIYLQITSANFDLVGTYVAPTQSGGNVSYYDWQGVSNQTFSFSLPQLQPNGYLGGVEKIGMRYCWDPPCETLDDTLDLTLSSYTVSCAGVINVDKDLKVHVVNDPEPINLDVPSSIFLKLDSIICLDLYALDNKFINISAYDDTLFLEPTSSYGFDFVGTFQDPILHTNGSYFYEDFTYTDALGVVQIIDTLFMENFHHHNNISAAIGEVGLRFCWTVDCDYVFQKEFDLNFMAYSTVCASDTVNATAHVEVDLPIADSQPVPNVFTPNKKGGNEYFQLTPHDPYDASIKYNDPCYDSLFIKIYNRWGQLVFESTDPNFMWDGTKNGDGKSPCKPGSYVVIIDGTFGSNYDSVTGERIPNYIKDEYIIQLLR